MGDRHIVANGAIKFAIPQSEQSLAKLLLQELSSINGSEDIVVHNKLETPVAGDLNVFNVLATGSITFPEEDDALILRGKNDVDVTVASSPHFKLIVGNGGDDHFSVADPFGDIFILGRGENSITATGEGRIAVEAPVGHVNTLVISDNIDAQLQDGTYAVTMSGHTTLEAGSAASTIQASGDTTIEGGSGDLVLFGSADTDDHMLFEAGPGHQQAYGSAGANTFITFDAGSIDLYSGAHYNKGATADTTDVFEFYNNHATGGITRIWGYTAGQDEILMSGYTEHDLKIAYTADGDTVIKLAADNSRLAVVEGVHLTMGDLVFG